MPSQFETMFANARTMLLRNYGQAVTCTPAGGAAVAATALVGAVGGELVEDNSTRQMFYQRTIDIPTADVTAARKMLVDIGGGDVWTVDEILGVGGGLQRVRAVKPVRQEKGGRTLSAGMGR